MRDIEIEIFTKSLKFAQEEFYLDAIRELKILMDMYPDSELIDDAKFNIGLCYFKLKQYNKAISEFESLISTYPNATISILEGGNEYGKTATKALYAIVNSYLALGDIKSANETLERLKQDSTSYVISNNEKFTFYRLAENLIQSMTK